MGVAEGLRRRVCVRARTCVKLNCRYMQLEGHVCLCGGKIYIKNSRSLLGTGMKALTPFPLSKIPETCLSGQVQWLGEDTKALPLTTKTVQPCDIVATLLTPV